MGNDRQMAQELRDNPELLQRIINSQDGQALMRMLTQADSGTRFRQAVEAAANGDTADMAHCLRQVTESREGAALVGRIKRMMRERNGGRYGGI